MITTLLRRLRHWIHLVLLDYPRILWVVRSIRFTLTLKRTLASQLAPLPSMRVPAPPRQSKRILMPQIETQHYQMYQMFILAKALELRGAEVAVLLCGSRLAGCETKSVRTEQMRDVCFECRFHHKHVMPLFRLPVFDLGDIVTDDRAQAIRQIAREVAAAYPDAYEFKGIDVIPMTNDSVVRYFYGAVPEAGVDLTAVREQHLASAMMGIDAAEFIERSYAPTTILNNMYVYSVTEPYLRYFGARDATEVRCISNTPADYHGVMLDMMDLYKSPDRFVSYKNSRCGQPLSAGERAELKALLERRTNGNLTMFADMGYFGARQDLEASLSIDRAKQNVFLFSNVYWDVGMSATGQAYSGVIEWVLDTIAALEGHPDVHLYIKPHPSEELDLSAMSLKGVADFVREKYPTLPENVTLILPGMKISPYDLFPFVDVGLVYNGTLGLEMMLAGIPVVVAGRAPYGGLGWCHEPQAPEAYRDLIARKVVPIAVDHDDLELFAYFYLIKTMIPWGLTRRAYADRFQGYTFQSIEALLPGRNRHLDHLCNCILNPEETVVENWG